MKTETYTDYSKEAENIHKEVYLRPMKLGKWQGETDWQIKGGQNKVGKQNSSKQEAGMVDSWRDYAIVTSALTWYSTSSPSWINGMYAGYLLH